MAKDNKASLLLLADVEELGRSGDIVQVKRGYARNYLLPKKKAVFADANAKRIQASLQEERKTKAAEDLKISHEVKERIEKLSLKVDVKVDPEGHMYGSIASVDIIQMLEKEGMKVEKKCVQLPKAIKTTGVHSIVVRLKEEVVASLKLTVLPEGITAEELAKITAPVEEIVEKTENPTSSKDVEGES
jgi:large subunit ribosomal protein L9